MEKKVKIKSIEYVGNEDTYNMEVKGYHNFSVNGGLIVHNCMDSIRYFIYTVLRYYVENEIKHKVIGKGISENSNSSVKNDPRYGRSKF